MLPHDLHEQVFQAGLGRGQADIVQAGLLQAPGQGLPGGGAALPR